MLHCDWCGLINGVVETVHANAKVLSVEHGVAAAAAAVEGNSDDEGDRNSSRGDGDGESGGTRGGIVGGSLVGGSGGGVLAMGLASGYLGRTMRDRGGAGWRAQLSAAALADACEASFGQGASAQPSLLALTRLQV